MDRANRSVQPKCVHRYRLSAAVTAAVTLPCSSVSRSSVEMESGSRRITSIRRAPSLIDLARDLATRLAGESGSWREASGFMRSATQYRRRPMPPCWPSCRCHPARRWRPRCRRMRHNGRSTDIPRHCPCWSGSSRRRCGGCDSWRWCCRGCCSCRSPVCASPGGWHG